MSDQSIIPIEYREVDGFPDYRVGDDGSVWTRKVCGSIYGKIGEWKQRSLSKNKNGYFYVLFRNGRGKSWFGTVHKAILLAFRGPPPKGYLARHLNGIRTDNRLCNLAWGTPKENVEDMYRHGHQKIGIDRWNAKLTEEDVRRIRSEFAGVSLAKVARVFGVSTGAIKGIRLGRSWKHLV